MSQDRTARPGGKIIEWVAVGVIVLAAAVTGFAKAADTPTIHGDFYVAPDGKDTNPGTAGAPFATLTRAQEAVRQKVAGGLSADLMVLIRGGMYRQQQMLLFGPQDSGTDKHSITYAAWPGEKVVLSGGRKITGWKKGRGNIWTAELPEVRAGKWQFRQLFVGGKRAVRARTPNADDKAPWWHIRTSTAGNPPSAKAIITASVTGPIRAYRNPDDVELVYIANNNGSRKHLGTINEQRQTFTLPPPHNWNPKAFGTEWSLSIPQAGMACFLENALEMMDQPGEWYLNRHTGVLSYWPRPGEDLTRDEVLAPVLGKTLLALRGRCGHRVTNLHFRGLHVEHVEWVFPDWGYLGMAVCTRAVGKDPSPGWEYVDAAVEFENARRCSFADGGIAQVGSIGLCLRNGTECCTVEGNEICDLGGGGVAGGYMENSAYGYVHAPPPRQDEHHGHRIANNYIHHCGTDDFGAFGISFAASRDTVIAHNLVHDTAYFGMCMAGDQGAQRGKCSQNNTIEYNHVYNAMQVTVDGAGLYVTFFYDYPKGEHGCLVRDNLIHDIVPNRLSSRPVGPYSAAGIYLDGGCSGARYESNVVYRACDSLFVNGEEKDAARLNRWSDNVFQQVGTPPREFVEAIAAQAGLDPAHRRSILKAEPDQWNCYLLPEPIAGENRWRGRQLDCPAKGKGVVEIFAMAESGKDLPPVKLHGLDASMRYELTGYSGTLDRAALPRLRSAVTPLPLAETGSLAAGGKTIVPGRDLMQRGFHVKPANAARVIWIGYQCKP
jgi:hypothetical protein